MNFNKGPVSPVVYCDAQGRVQSFEGEKGSAAMFRWWIPCGFVDKEEIRREIETVAAHGFRGLEICINMADTHYSREELKEKGWGTEHWKETYKYILKTANQYNIQIDMTISPGWPAGVVGISPEDDCASKELLTCTSPVFQGRFSGILPMEIDTGTIDPVQLAQNGPPPAVGFDEEEYQAENRWVLEAVTAARIESTGTIPMTAGRFAPPASGADGPTTTQYRLAPESMQVVENYAHCSNSDSWQVDFQAPDDGNWLLFAFWKRGTAQTNRQGTATAQPCYAVDHMNRRGAEAVIDFWEKHILDDELRALLRENNGVIFEDSIELDLSDYAIHWGMEHLERFRQYRGYDLTPYLPLLTGLTYMDPKQYKYEIGDGRGGVSELGARIRNDYCQLVTILYAQEHITPIQNWAASLGMGYRSQGYGLPFDLMEIASVSHGPEGESLGFGDGVRSDDRFRTVSGGAHAGGRPIISDEMGAVAGAGYRWTWKSMLDIINSNWAGGANLIIFHGFPYAKSNSSSWPGYSPFGFGLAGQWGPRQPEWDYIDDLSAYLRRTQSILQGGKPAVDVAVMSVYYEGFNFDGVFHDQTMAQMGYTYDLLSVNNLRQTEARVENGRFFPEGAAYRALVLDNQRLFPVEAMERILALAETGFPVILVGALPSASAFYGTDWEVQDRKVNYLCHRLCMLKNVIQVETEDQVPAALKAQGILPAAEIKEPVDFLSVHRIIDGADYYYILYRGKTEMMLSLTLSGKGGVTRWDSWSGKVMTVASAQTAGGQCITVWMKPGETAIFRVGVLSAANCNPGRVRELLRISGGWSLEFERWERDETASDTTATQKTLIRVEQVPMKPWTEFLGPEFSGIGTYKRTVSLPGKMAEEAKVLSFADIKCQSVHLYINGEKVPVNHLNWTADCAGKFRAGENELCVVVVSTLGNQLMAYGAFPQMPWMKEKEVPAKFGLLGDLVLLG